MKFRTLIRFFPVLGTILIFTACAPVSQPGPTDPAPTGTANEDSGGGDPSAAVHLFVSASNETPKAGESIELQVEIKPNADLPPLALTLELPAEAELADESFFWQEELKLNQPQTVLVKVDILEWPLSEPIKVMLQGDTGRYWAFWPQKQSPALPAFRAGEVDDLQVGVEPSPVVELSLQVDPPHPQPGELTRFVVTMRSQMDFLNTLDPDGLPLPGAPTHTCPTSLNPLGGPAGQLELPPEFDTAAAPEMLWQGELLSQQIQKIEFYAVPNAEPSGAARFVLYPTPGGRVFVEHLFSPYSAPDQLRLPELFEDQNAREIAPAYEDDLAPSPGQQPLAAAQLPLLDYTVVETGRDERQISLAIYLFANQDLTHAHISVELPAALALAQGELEWQGNLAAGQVAIMEATLDRLDSDSGALLIYFASDQGNLDPYRYTFSLDGDADALSDIYFHNESGAEAPTLGAPGAGTLSLSGRMGYYEDMSTLRGAYFTRIQVYDEDGSTDAFVCQATTDSNGYWSCSGTATDPSDDTVEIYFQARVYNSNYGSVKDSSDDEFDWVSGTFNMSENGGSHDFGTHTAGDHDGYDGDGAYHIHKMGVRANQTTRDLGGETPPVYNQTGFVTFIWPDVDTDSSSEYGSWKIYIEGPGSLEPDTWDESPIMHEYGHYLMDFFAVTPPWDYCNDQPGIPPEDCSHNFYSHEDAPTAYMEGWANYYQAAVKTYYGMADDSLYIETTWDEDLNTFCFPIIPTHADVEGAVAGAMWDINDNDGVCEDQNGDGIGDCLYMGHNELHDTFSNDPSLYTSPPDDIHDFYDSFNYRNTFDNEVLKIFFEHGINKDFFAPYNGSININGGATYANSTNVTLSLSASDTQLGVDEMRMYNSGSSWTAWQDYLTSKSWNLLAGDGSKTVYVQFRDYADNATSSYSDSIILDTTLPVNPTMWSSTHTKDTWSNDNTITANWSGANDATSGVDGYGIYWSQGATDTPSTIWDTSGTSDTSSTLSDGAWYFHLRTVDNAGNWSGAKHLGPYYIDTTAPSSNVSSLPASSCMPSFTVFWSGSDPSPGSGNLRYDVQYKIGGGAWTTWKSYTSLTSAAFGSGGSPVTPVLNETYSFRARAYDLVDNLEAYPASPDASTTMISCSLGESVYLPIVVR